MVNDSPTPEELEKDLYLHFKIQDSEDEILVLEK